MPCLFFGIAVVEAMAAGIPVFVNDWRVMCEIINNGEFGTLYKTANEDDLLEKFMLYLQHKEIDKHKANQIADIVKKKYSIHQHITKLREVYVESLNHC